MRRVDFGERRPRSARRAVAVAPVRRAPRRSDRPQPAAAAMLLQHVGVRAHGELGDQPDQVGRQAAVFGAGANRVVVALKRRGEQRARLHARLSNRRPDVIGGVGRASLRELLAEADQRRRQHGHRQRDRFAGQRGHASTELGGHVAGWQRQPRQSGAFDPFRQVEDQTDQLPLQTRLPARDRAVPPEWPSSVAPHVPAALRASGWGPAGSSESQWYNGEESEEKFR